MFMRSQISSLLNSMTSRRIKTVARRSGNPDNACRTIFRNSFCPQAVKGSKNPLFNLMALSIWQSGASWVIDSVRKIPRKCPDRYFSLKWSQIFLFKILISHTFSVDRPWKRWRDCKAAKKVSWIFSSARSASRKRKSAYRKSDLPYASTHISGLMALGKIFAAVFMLI